MNHLTRFTTLFAKLDSDNLHLLGDIYNEEIEFTDPAHTIRGLDHLTRYFSSLYENSTVSIRFLHTVYQHPTGYIQWIMKIQNARLNGGEDFEVAGVSRVEFDENGKIAAHTDYFDLGALIYERLPLLGRLIRTIKGRLGK
jgi:hypothetical protein